MKGSEIVMRVSATSARQASVAILAGGQSRRMGQNKSFVHLDGRPLVERVIERVVALGLPVQIIANDPARYAPFGLPVFTDLIPGKGSLGGLYTAIDRSPTLWTLCVACDMPFLNTALLASMLGQCQDDWDAVVPVIAGRPQSLHAVYHRRCLPTINAALQRDDLKIQRLLGQLPVHFIDETAISTLDPGLRSFINLNTPDELNQAQQLVPDGTSPEPHPAPLTCK